MLAGLELDSASEIRDWIFDSPTAWDNTDLEREGQVETVYGCFRIFLLGPAFRPS